MEAQDQIQRKFQIMTVFMHVRASKAPYHRMRVNIKRTLVGNKSVNHSDVAGASPVGAAPTPSSFAT